MVQVAHEGVNGQNDVLDKVEVKINVITKLFFFIVQEDFSVFNKLISDILLCGKF